MILPVEDRAIATAVREILFPKLAADIAARAASRFATSACGGRRWFPGGLGVHTPDWAAPALPLARQLVDLATRGDHRLLAVLVPIMA